MLRMLAIPDSTLLNHLVRFADSRSWRRSCAAALRDEFPTLPANTHSACFTHSPQSTHAQPRS